MRVLILGGTGEARALADRLVALGHEVTTSLAGRTVEPLMPQGTVRVGGFGGAERLGDYIVAGGFERVVLATHPYAVEIARNCMAAVERTGVGLVRLVRPGWVEPDGVAWVRVKDLADAAAVVPAGARVLLTVGQRGLEGFLARADIGVVVRVIEAPVLGFGEGVKVVLARPPYDVAGEMDLMRAEGITHLVTKNAGGAQTAAKLEAAQQMGVVVVMVERPEGMGGAMVGSVEEAVAALGVLGVRRGAWKEDGPRPASG